MKPSYLPSPNQHDLPDTNPQHVLHSIGAAGGQSAMSSQLPGQPTDVRQADAVPALRLVMAPDEEPESQLFQEHDDDVLQTTIESAKQIQQLASRLRQTQEQLESRKRKLNAEIKAQRNFAGHQQRLTDRHLSQLQQQTSQVRVQQRNLMQLQSAIIDSNEAVKIAIEQLIARERTDATTLQQMQAIRDEVTDRFDYISRRWQHLHTMLEHQRIQLEAAEAERRVA